LVESQYPTSCDLPLAASNLFDIHVQREHTAWVYDVNLRQDITDDIMVYAGFNHNWRGPGISQGNVPPQYVLVDPETSDNYEVGFKGDFLDRRVRVTAAAFQQDFEDYNATVSNVPFLDGTGTVVDAFSITYNGDAVVRGFEADVDTRITDQWSLRASVAYAKGEFKNALQPCRDANFDGVPDGGTPTALGFTGAGVNVATCPTNGRINGLPEWSYTVQSEYSHPLSHGEAYVRGLYNWRSEGQIVSSSAPIESYGTLDLYLGARDIIGDLDVNIFVKNAFDEVRRFDQGGELSTFGYASGYRSVYYTTGREIGISARKTFGGG
jgi:iron complex outermembrane recepter protein